MILNNVDLFLMAYNSTDMILDTDYYKYECIDFDRTEMIKELQRSSNKKKRYTCDWYEICMESEDRSCLFKSVSTFDSDRKKEYSIGAKLQDLRISKDLISELGFDMHEELGESNNRVMIELIEKNKIMFSDLDIKFGVLGDVTFFCRVTLKNTGVTEFQYSELIRFLQKIMRMIYKDRFADICCTYIKVLSELAIKDKKKYRLLQINLSKFDLITEKCKHSRERSMYSISWLHFIHDKMLYNDKNYLEKLYPITKMKNSMSELEELDFDDAKIVTSWSHIIVVTDKEIEANIEKLINFYKPTVEMAWGEWEFIDKLIKNIDILLYNSYSIFENKRNCIFGTKKYKENIDKLYFFINRIIDEFDSTSYTLNRKQVKFVESIRMNWDMSERRDTYRKKSESLRGMVNYISDREKSKHSKLLNGVLFIIALLSTIDISNTIYEMLINGMDRQLLFSTAPVTTIFIVIFLFVRLSGE